MIKFNLLIKILIILSCIGVGFWLIYSPHKILANDIAGGVLIIGTILFFITPKEVINKTK